MPWARADKLREAMAARLTLAVHAKWRAIVSSAKRAVEELIFRSSKVMLVV